MVPAAVFTLAGVKWTPIKKSVPANGGPGFILRGCWESSLCGTTTLIFVHFRGVLSLSVRRFSLCCWEEWENDCSPPFDWHNPETESQINNHTSHNIHLCSKQSYEHFKCGTENKLSWCLHYEPNYPHQQGQVVCVGLNVVSVFVLYPGVVPQRRSAKPAHRFHRWSHPADTRLHDVFRQTWGQIWKKRTATC